MCHQREIAKSHMWHRPGVDNSSRFQRRRVKPMRATKDGCHAHGGHDVGMAPGVRTMKPRQMQKL